MQPPAMKVCLRSRWVIPMAQPPIPGGWVTIVDGTIAAVGPAEASAHLLDLGDVAILPGLINAHTHLEFSDLQAPFGEPAISFPDWIRHVIDWRRRQAASGEDVDAARDRAVCNGLKQSATAGTVAVGEIAAYDHAPTDWNTPVRGVVFRELLGLVEERAAQLPDIARRHLSGFGAGCQRVVPGLSPHAPYTVRPETVKWICDLSRQKDVPVAMHLAESPEELELLECGRGSLAELLEELEAWDRKAIPAGTRPLDYLRNLARCARALVVHGNYLSQDEIEFVGSQRSRISVVYCPRTHAHFGFRPYPLTQMLDAGVNVCLGTDSRASSPDLSLWRDLQFAAKRHPQIAPDVLLGMATANAARAFGWTGGVLEAGRPADLTIVSLPDSSAASPLDALLAGPSQVVGTYIAGQPA